MKPFRRLPLPLAGTVITLLCAQLAGCNPTRDGGDDAQSDSPPLQVASAERMLDALLPDEAPVPADYLDDPIFDLPSDHTHSIWPRIREGFRIEADLDHPSVQAEIDWYSSHQEYIYRTTRRAEPFLYYILEETEKRGLPTELILLPIVESAFQPFAYSHGRAAGIWQFIPSTGRLYGLRQDWWYDGRRDVHASTQAALQFLDNLNTLFDGDWLLALAAYNSGSGTVQRAIKRNRQLGRPTDFWHLKLPRETRAYVPKLLALKELIRDPAAYDIGLLCVPDAPGFVKVDTGSQIDLALAADLAEMDIDRLYELNPAFNRWATAPEGPHHLLLPYENAEIFKAKLALLPEDKRIRWQRHKVGEGETLSHIALKYHTTVRELRKSNNLRSNRIRAGKYLLIPVASADSSRYTLSSDQRKKAKQSVKRGKARIDHVVRNGESFWTISRKYGVNMHHLAKWNGMAIRDMLKNGQKLVVWTDDAGAVDQEAGRIHHTVQSGESFWTIARKYDVDMHSLAEWNNLSTKDTLRKGQRLVVHAGDDAAGPVLSLHKPSNTIRSISYTVRNGDSLSRIASRYNVSVADLHRWNTIKGKYIQPGQRLKVYIDITEQAGEG